MLRSRYCFLCAIAMAVLAALLLSPAPASAQGKPVSFINDVAPIIKENCFACHDAKKRSGKYDMSTFEKLMAGGAAGAPIAAGKPKDSDFHDLMITKDERRMPPRDKGEAVAAEKSAIIEKWIVEGAKLDAGIDPKADLLKELRFRWKPPVAPVAYKFPVVVNSVAFTPDNKNLVVGAHHELTVWSLPDAKLTKRIAMRAERAYAMAFLPDGKLAVAGGRPGQEGDVRIYDLGGIKGRTESGVEFLDGVSDPKVMVKQLLDADDSVLCLAVAPDGKHLAAGGCDRTIRYWDISGGAATAKLEQSIENHADWILGIALSADNKFLVSAARDKTAKVWDIKAKESVMTFPDHQEIVYGVALNADATVGYSIGKDKQLRSWKPGGDAKQMKNVGGHTDEVFKIVANTTGAMLATGSGDKSVRLWDAKAMTSTKALAGLTDHVFAVAFSPDGTLVAGGSFAGEVGVWKTADPKDVKPVALFNATPGLAAKK